jgi:hypothetical protein
MSAARASAALAALACILQAFACDEVASHPFPARLYEPGRGCVGAPIALDVVEGPDPGGCAATCIVRSGDGGRDVYVSTMCAPYPPFHDTTGADPLCGPALAAFARTDLCLSDGGSTRPLPPSGVTDAAAPDGG